MIKTLKHIHEERAYPHLNYTKGEAYVNTVLQTFPEKKITKSKSWVFGGPIRSIVLCAVPGRFRQVYDFRDEGYSKLKIWWLKGDGKLLSDEPVFPNPYEETKVLPWCG